MSEVVYVVDKDIAEQRGINNDMGVPAIVGLLSNAQMEKPQDIDKKYNKVVYLAPLIIFYIIFSILYYYSNKMKKFRKLENCYIYIGLGISTIILLIYYIQDNPSINIQWDKTSQQLLWYNILNKEGKKEHEMEVINSNNPFTKNNDEKKTNLYWVSKKNFDIATKKNKTDMMSWGKWAQHFLATTSAPGLKISSNVDSYIGEIFNSQLNILGSHFYKMLVILLTVAFNTVNWNLEVYKRLSIWIYTILILEVLISSFFVVTSNLNARNYIYIKGRLQAISSCLGIVLIFLYMGSASTVKS